MCVVAYVRGRIKVPTHGSDVKRAYRAISSTPLDKSVESFGSVDSIRDFDSFWLSIAQPAVSTTSTPFGCFGCFDYFNILRMLDRFDARGLRQ